MLDATTTPALVQVTDLKMHFPIYSGLLRRHTGEELPGSRRAGLGHHVFKAIETVGLGANRM